jgi:hypothetical protein
MQSSGYLASLQTQIKLIGELSMQTPQCQISIKNQSAIRKHNISKTFSPLTIHLMHFAKEHRSFHESSAAKPASATQII